MPSSSELRDLCMNVLDQHKGFDIVAIDIQGKSPIADYIIVASGNASRHVVSLADKCAEELRRIGHKSQKPIGTEQGDWVLLDAGDIIIHLFRPEVRRIL